MSIESKPVGVIEYFEGQACVVGIDPEFSRLPEGTKLYAAPTADALYEALRQITREYIRTCVQLNGDKEEEMQDVTCVRAANKALAAHKDA